MPELKRKDYGEELRTGHQISLWMHNYFVSSGQNEKIFILFILSIYPSKFIVKNTGVVSPSNILNFGTI